MHVKVGRPQAVICLTHAVGTRAYLPDDLAHPGDA